MYDYIRHVAVVVSSRRALSHTHSLTLVANNAQTTCLACVRVYVHCCCFYNQARNEEKAQSMLNKWVTMKETMAKGGVG